MTEVRSVSGAQPTGARSASRIASIVALAGVGVAVLWFLLDWVIAADRGIDLTDEGLYLLAARPPSLEAAYGFPFGWHTAPLFRAVGYDVATFRILGAFILVTLSGMLGAVAVRSASTASVPAIDDLRAGTGHGVRMALGAVVGGLGGLLSYGGLVRTPGYNWVNVVGATIAAIGLLRLLEVESRPQVRASMGSGSIRAFDRSTAGAVVLAGFGAFYALPGKPSTPIFFALLALPVLALASGVRRAVALIAAISTTSVAFIGAVVALGWWSPRFVQMFLRALSAPTPMESQSLAGAVRVSLGTPITLLSEVRIALLLALVVGVRFVPAGLLSPYLRSRGRAIGVVVVLPVLILTALLFGYSDTITTFIASTVNEATSFGDLVARGSHALRDVATIVIASAPTIAIVTIAAAWLITGTNRAFRVLLPAALFVVIMVDHAWTDSSLFARVGSERWVRESMLISVVLVSLSVLLLDAAASTWPNRKARYRLHRPSTAGVTSMFLLLFGVATGFGSGHGLVRQAALASGIMLPGVLLQAVTRSDRHVRRSSLALVATFTAIATAVYTADNFTHPYRMAPIAEQTVLVPVGSDGALLHVERERAAMLQGLTIAAAEAGWMPGTPLIAVVSRWSSTLPWHLGARVPESLMPTLGLGTDQPAAALLRYNLEWAFEDMDGAWLMMTAEGEPTREDSLALLHIVTQELELPLLQSYRLVYRSPPGLTSYGSVELWAPS